MLKRKPKEYKRTCKQCGNVWFIPKELAKEKAPNRMEMAGAKVSAAGSSMSLISFKGAAKQAQVQALEEKKARVLENSRCPACGSSRFKQEKA